MDQLDLYTTSFGFGFGLLFSSLFFISFWFLGISFVCLYPLDVTLAVAVTLAFAERGTVGARQGSAEVGQGRGTAGQS